MLLKVCLELTLSQVLGGLEQGYGEGAVQGCWSQAPANVLKAAGPACDEC